MSVAADPTLRLSVADRALEVLRRAGNPFRNYFARSPDDEVCARYHVPELFCRERELLLQVVDLYRYAPTTHSEVVPVLGNKGSGKTHLLHSIKHGAEGAWQLLVTPGTYQRDNEFLEYLLFQVIDTLLGGGRQKEARPLHYIGEVLVRHLLASALGSLTQEQRLQTFPASALGPLGKWLGLGASQAAERAQWLYDTLQRTIPAANCAGSITRACDEVGLEQERAVELISEYVARTEPHNPTAMMRRRILEGFARVVLLQDESDLASFLTYGFAELPFQVQPTRQDLVLALFKSLMGILQGLRIPVVVAFDQLEDLLLARRSDDAHRTAEAFFAGIVQAMHQLDGISFLIFAERGLWNRFVPSLDGYIQDRLNNPIHLPGHGTFQALRLEAPSPELVRKIVEIRLRPALEELPDFAQLDSIFPFTAEQVDRVARTEPTLRDMLQQFRHLFDHLIYGPTQDGTGIRPTETDSLQIHPEPHLNTTVRPGSSTSGLDEKTLAASAARVASSFQGGQAPQEGSHPRVKSVMVVESPGQSSSRPADVESVPPQAGQPLSPPIPTQETKSPTAPTPAPKTPQDPPASPRTATPQQLLPPAKPSRTPQEMDPAQVPSPAPQAPAPASARISFETLSELWDQEMRSARRKLEPDGALTGGTREVQAGMGAFLEVCHEHGVKVGPWRLHHVVREWTFGEHPTYGVMTIAHWVCRDGQPWRVGVGLFLGKGPAKPRDLGTKLSALQVEPAVIDHLILLRPEDDLNLTGKSKALWQEGERRGHHTRLEPTSVDAFAILYAFPRFLANLTEALPEGQPLPNLADLIQDKCEKLLEQVCMPVQG